MKRAMIGPSSLDVLDSEECKKDFERLGSLQAFVPRLLILKQEKRIYVFTDTDNLRAKLKRKDINV